ncbi:hypothetical protein ACFL5K_06450 [Gemmatimonadota bacterium]
MGYHSLKGAYTLEEEGEDKTLETGNTYYYAGGMRYAHHKNVPKITNPEILRAVDLYFVKYRKFNVLVQDDADDVTKSRVRFIINAYSKLTSNTYAGFRADLGEFEQHISVWAGLKWSYSDLLGLTKLVGSED